MVDQNEGVDETTVNVARQIRILRKRRDLSQQALAEASGLSRNTLSLLERGQTSPTVSTLKRLAMALGVDINAFFDTSDDESIIYTKNEQRLNLQLSQGLMADLGVGMHDQLVTPLILKLNPGARSGPALSHDGQDFVYCISGEILYTVNGKSFLLESGDSLFFDAHLQHRFQNTATEVSEVLVILSTPHESSQYISGHFPENHEPDE
ncbi:MAG: helix-turn-helix domain-containing protein [Chloroflexota bacterium]|nr:MAG: helix-turn-helix domain-containing protein [Chloroflexota bacterium]